MERIVFRSGRVIGIAMMLPLLAQNDVQAVQATVDITVMGVRDSTGHVRVALCTQETFLNADCPYHAASPAQAGTTKLRIEGVPPGAYALEVFHDDRSPPHRTTALLLRTVGPIL